MNNSLAAKLLDAVGGGGCAAYVCNTVASAQGFYDVLLKVLNKRKGDPGILRLFHARYPFEERDRRERKSVQEFGKDAGKNGNLPRPERAILVATQVIEQSLDLDFDLMVTDLAPVDLILQRSGRLMRHVGLGISRHSFDEEKPVLWIRRPPSDAQGLPDFGGSKKVYPEYTRLRTMIALGSGNSDLAFRVPKDVEELIEKVYDDNINLDVPEHLAVRLESAKTDLEKRIGQLLTEAKARLIKQPAFEGDLEEIAGGDLEEDAPDVHKVFQALTRWSDLPSVSLICLHAKDGRAYLDSNCAEPVSLDREPDERVLRRLMRQEMRLSGHSVANYEFEGTPRGWAKVGFLRHHRLALFEDGLLRGPSFTLRLDPDLGGVIEYDKREEEDEH